MMNCLSFDVLHFINVPPSLHFLVNNVPPSHCLVRAPCYNFVPNYGYTECSAKKKLCWNISAWQIM